MNDEAKWPPEWADDEEDDAGHVNADMVVGVGVIVLRIHDCHSLKEKRKVVKGMIQQLRNRYNAAVAEVGANDVYHIAEIGLSIIGNDRREINSRLDRLFNFAESLGLAEIADTEMEIINL